jgi:iron complex outermembrane recepter protein
MKNSYWRRCVAGIVLLGVVEIAAAAEAEAPDETAQTSGLQEIVVTAQKREQKQNDVGITIVAASAAQLQAAGVTDITRLNAVVPGFSVGISPFGSPIIALRGVSFNSGQISAPPTVSTYVDEAALPYSAMTAGMLLDIERIEVLKGPQGTLFGQNATGGSINVIAAKPTDHFTAGFQTEVNHFGEVDFQGHVSGPLSDNLRARLAASTSQLGAWQEGYYLNHQKNGDQNKAAVRLLLDWTPIERLKISTNLNANYDRGEVQQGQAALFTPANPAGAPPGLVGYKPPTKNRDADFDLGFNTHARNQTYQGVVRADYDVTDDAVLTSITNYVNTQIHLPHDQEATAIPDQEGVTLARLETIGQELRITGKIPSASVDYVLGGSYQSDDVHDGVAVNYMGFSGLPVGAQVDWRYRITTKAAGVFGNLDYEFLPGLALTTGVRYTSVRQHFSGCTYDGGSGLLSGTANFISDLLRGASGLSPSTGLFVPGGCITINDTGSNPDFLPIVSSYEQDQHNVSWRGGLNYKPTTDSLLYVLVSRGFKAGTFPVIFSFAQSGITPVSQEQLTSYEIGAKLSLLDRRLQFNASAFHYDYINKQFFTFKSAFGLFNVATVVNIPKSKVDGADFDIVAQPFERLTVRGAVTYIHTKIDKYSGLDYLGQPRNYDGSEFDFAPPVAATADAEYRMPVGSGGLEAYIGGNLTYNARTWGDLGEIPAFSIPSYLIADARLGVVSPKGWRAGFFVRNLADRYYWSSVVSGGDTAVRYTGRPRTFGLTVAVDY